MRRYLILVAVIALSTTATLGQTPAAGKPAIAKSAKARATRALNCLAQLD